MRGNQAGSGSATFLAAVAAFAAGLVAGWLLFAGGPHQGPTAPTDPSAPASAVSAQPSRAGRAPSTTDKLDSAAESAIATAAEMPFAFRSLAGTGAIRGTVTTEMGEPISGVEIRAHAHTPPECDAEVEGRDWDDIPLEEGLRRFARERRWWDLSRKSTRTAADGTFALTDLADMDWSVSAHAEGLVFDAPRVDEDAARAGAEIDFVATPFVRFDVDVRMADRSRPTRTSLDWTREDGIGTASMWWWPGSPSAALEPGRWRLSATCGDDRRYKSQPMSVDVRRGVDPVVVTLAPRRGIAVTARRPAGFRELDLNFYLVRAESGEPTDVDLYNSRVDGTRRYELGDEERCTFLDLDAGRWVAAAGIDGGTSLAKQAVVVTEGIVECRLEVPAPDPSRFIDVVATRPDGAPLADVSFRWSLDRVPFPGYAVSRGLGKWRVWRPRLSLGFTRWSLAASSPDYCPVTVDVPPGSDGPVAFRFERPSAGVIHVHNLPPGVDPRRFQVSIDEGDDWRSSWLADDGTASIAPVPPGRRSVRLRVWQSTTVGVRSVFVPIERCVAEFRAGERTPIEITAPAFHPLEIDVGRSNGVDFVQLVPVGPVSGGATEESLDESLMTDADGRVQLDLVPAGKWRLIVGDQQHEFSVPQTRTFKLP